MHITPAHLLRIATLGPGVLVLFVPRILGFVVAVYLMFVGLSGLYDIYHFIK